MNNINRSIWRKYLTNPCETIRQWADCRLLATAADGGMTNVGCRERRDPAVRLLPASAQHNTRLLHRPVCLPWRGNSCNPGDGVRECSCGDSWWEMGWGSAAVVAADESTYRGSASPGAGTAEARGDGVRECSCGDSWWEMGWGSAAVVTADESTYRGSASPGAGTAEARGDGVRKCSCGDSWWEYVLTAGLPPLAREQCAQETLGRHRWLLTSATIQENKQVQICSFRFYVRSIIASEQRGM